MRRRELPVCRRIAPAWRAKPPPLSLASANQILIESTVSVGLCEIVRAMHATCFTWRTLDAGDFRSRCRLEREGLITI